MDASEMPPTDDEKKMVEFAIYCATVHTMYNIPGPESIPREISTLKVKYLEIFGKPIPTWSIVQIILRGMVIELEDGSYMHAMANCMPAWIEATLAYLDIATTRAPLSVPNALPVGCTVATWRM
jgi:hypothetical protein